MSHEEKSRPEQPPLVSRPVSFYSYEVVGVGILLAVVLMAVLKVFGATSTTARFQGSSIAVELDYPSKLRYKTIDPIDITVTNTGENKIARATVRISDDYLSEFSNVNIDPAPEQIADGAYEIVLTEIEPRSSRKVTLEVQAEKYWRHEGWIEVQSGRETLRERISTTVLP